MVGLGGEADRIDAPLRIDQEGNCDRHPSQAGRHLGGRKDELTRLRRSGAGAATAARAAPRPGPRSRPGPRPSTGSSPATARRPTGGRGRVRRGDDRRGCHLLGRRWHRDRQRGWYQWHGWRRSDLDRRGQGRQGYRLHPTAPAPAPAGTRPEIDSGPARGLIVDRLAGHPNDEKQHQPVNHRGEDRAQRRPPGWGNAEPDRAPGRRRKALPGGGGTVGVRGRHRLRRRRATSKRFGEEGEKGTPMLELDQGAEGTAVDPRRCKPAELIPEPSRPRRPFGSGTSRTPPASAAG
jgi:hypothetical protein